MIRKAFVMELTPGCEEEYEKRHNPIWQDLIDVFAQHGVHNYSIFLHEVGHLLNDDILWELGGCLRDEWKLAESAQIKKFHKDPSRERMTPGPGHGGENCHFGEHTSIAGTTQFQKTNAY